MDWITILRDQQIDFIKRLRSNSSVLHQMKNYKLTDYHSELIVVSGHLLNRMQKFYHRQQTKKLPNIYQKYINTDEFQEKIKSSFSKLIVQQYLNSMIKVVDKNHKSLKEYAGNFYLTLNPSYPIFIAGKVGSRYTATWSVNIYQIPEPSTIVFVLIEEDFDSEENNQEYKIILAGFLPTEMLNHSQPVVKVSIEDLLYSGGLKSYLESLEEIGDQVPGQDRQTPPSTANLDTTWICTQTIREEQSLLSLAISGDHPQNSQTSPCLATGGLDQNLKIWDLSTGQVKQILNQHRYPVFCLDFSPDGQTLAIGSMHETIELWDLGNGDREPYLQNLLEGHSLGVFSLHFTPDGQMLISRSLEETIKIWDLNNGELVQTLDSRAGPVWSEAISPDGTILATGNLDESIKIWHLEKKSAGEFKADEVYTLDEHTDIVRCLAFSPDGQFLASGSADRTIKIWRLNQLKEKPSVISTLKGHSDVVHCLAFSPNSQILASGSADDTIKLWHLSHQGNNYGASLAHTLTEHSGLVWAVKFAPNGKTLVSGSQDGTIKIWDQC
jgi:hypothetical protein